MTELFTTLSEPKFDSWRETHIDYTESFGDAYKSLSIETYLTFEEIEALVKEMLDTQKDDAE